MHSNITPCAVTATLLDYSPDYDRVWPEDLIITMFNVWNTGYLNALHYMKLVKTFLGTKTYY